ncbi:hypothetical protein BDV59DRAFT_151893 [Aspergillus ambiguus]|uniref:uncharacterized protein n=1 Tax=Aspergillus ambiguus TaxID=176160 RepID=UPI003CCD808F
MNDATRAPWLHLVLMGVDYGLASVPEPQFRGLLGPTGTVLLEIYYAGLCGSLKGPLIPILIRACPWTTGEIIKILHCTRLSFTFRPTLLPQECELLPINGS